MQVEGLLFKSGLNFTILQPAAYLQNLLQYKKGYSGTKALLCAL